jgi:hypothetical protein
MNLLYDLKIIKTANQLRSEIIMGKINKERHPANKMPKNPTREQRMKWHIEHLKNCNCHPVSAKIQKEIDEFRKKIRKANKNHLKDYLTYLKRKTNNSLQSICVLPKFSFNIRYRNAHKPVCSLFFDFP